MSLHSYSHVWKLFKALIPALDVWLACSSCFDFRQSFPQQLPEESLCLRDFCGCCSPTRFDICVCCIKLVWPLLCCCIHPPQTETSPLTALLLRNLQVPSDAQVKALTAELQDRSKLPPHVMSVLKVTPPPPFPFPPPMAHRYEYWSNRSKEHTHLRTLASLHPVPQHRFACS